MAGEQYEGAIKEAVSRVDELASSMEKVREDFLSATTAWFKQFATSSVERAVMEGGDVTKSLQDADLGRLKAELKDLIGRAEGLGACRRNAAAPSARPKPHACG